MTMTSPEDLEQCAAALAAWHRGDRQEAIDSVRRLADDELVPIALGLMAWFMSHSEPVEWTEGVPYALAAAKAGMPWVTNYYVEKLLDDPTLAAQGVELVKLTVESGWSIDPIALARRPLQRDDWGTAERLLDTAGPWPRREGWAELVASAQADAQRLHDLAHQRKMFTEDLESAIQAIDNDIHEQKNRVVTQISHLLTLVEQATNVAAQALFDAEATANKREAVGLWRSGVTVLWAAVAMAAVPLFLHYSGIGGQRLDGNALLTAHLTPTLALGAVSGVLLARSRGRDRARQRARDLSIALGTMFAYSGQIADESERQRFVHDMGRVVIESSLRQSAPAEDPTSPLMALLSAARK